MLLCHMLLCLPAPHCSVLPPRFAWSSQVQFHRSVVSGPVEYSRPVSFREARSRRAARFGTAKLCTAAPSRNVTCRPVLPLRGGASLLSGVLPPRVVLWGKVPSHRPVLLGIVELCRLVRSRSAAWCREVMYGQVVPRNVVSCSRAWIGTGSVAFSAAAPWCSHDVGCRKVLPLGGE